MPRKDLIQLRSDTAANWASVNPILAVGEQGFETDTGKSKIGNGFAAWNSLSYLYATSNDDQISSLRRWHQQFAQVRQGLVSGTPYSTDVLWVGDSIGEGWSSNGTTTMVNVFTDNLSRIANPNGRGGRWVPAGGDWYGSPKFSDNDSTLLGNHTITGNTFTDGKVFLNENFSTSIFPSSGNATVFNVFQGSVNISYTGKADSGGKTVLTGVIILSTFFVVPTTLLGSGSIVYFGGSDLVRTGFSLRSRVLLPSTTSGQNIGDKATLEFTGDNVIVYYRKRNLVTGYIGFKLYLKDSSSVYQLIHTSSPINTYTNAGPVYSQELYAWNAETNYSGTLSRGDYKLEVYNYASNPDTTNYSVSFDGAYVCDGNSSQGVKVWNSSLAGATFAVFNNTVNNTLNADWLSALRNGLVNPSLVVIALGTNQSSDTSIIESGLIAMVNSIKDAYAVGFPTLTTFTVSGTSSASAGTYTNVTGATSGSGTDAVFTITKTGSGTAYSGSTTVTPITRTNLCPNPSFETNTTGWAGTATTTIARITSAFYVGTACLSVTSTSATDTLARVTYDPNSTISAGVKITASAYVYNYAGNARQHRIDIRCWNGAYILSTITGTATTVNVGSGWTRLSVTGTTVTGTNSIDVAIYTQANNPSLSNVSYVDAVLVEQASTALTYFDGNDYKGAWSGTTNNSTSTMVAGGVNYAVGDTITIPGTSLGGTSPLNDLTLTVVRPYPSFAFFVPPADSSMPSSEWDLVRNTYASVASSIGAAIWNWAEFTGDINFASSPTNGTGDPYGWTSDSIHPNTSGHRAIGDFATSQALASIATDNTNVNSVATGYTIYDDVGQPDAPDRWVAVNEIREITWTGASWSVGAIIDRVGPSGPGYTLIGTARQPFERYKVVSYNQVVSHNISATSNTLTSFGNTTTTGTGSQTAVAAAQNSPNADRFTSAATASATAGFQQTAPITCIGTGTDWAVSGFDVRYTVRFNDASYNNTGASTGSRIAVGLSSAGSIATVLASDSLANSFVGFVRRHVNGGATDTNWTLLCRGASGPTTFDTGVPFIATKWYTLRFWMAPGATTVGWEIKNHTDGTTTSGVWTPGSNLPTASTMLGMFTGVFTVDAVARSTDVNHASLIT